MGFAFEHHHQIHLMPQEKSFVSPCEVATKSDGGIELSDHEWAAVEPILLDGLRLTRIKLNQRFLFDNLLQKIHTKSSWKNLPCKIGKWNNTQRAYEIWRKNGALIKAVNLLNTMRQSATALSSNLAASAELKCNFQMSSSLFGAELKCHTQPATLH